MAVFDNRDSGGRHPRETDEGHFGHGGQFLVDDQAWTRVRERGTMPDGGCA